MVNAECDKTDLSDLCSLESRKAAAREQDEKQDGEEEGIGIGIGIEEEQLPNCRANDLTYEEEICYARRARHIKRGRDPRQKQSARGESKLARQTRPEMEIARDYGGGGG